MLQTNNTANRINKPLAPESLPKSHQETFPRPNKWIQTQLINQPKQKKRQLIRAVRSKARQLIKDQQSEDLLINLIDASQRPYILELNHKIFTNQDLDIDPFTSEERQFWTSLDPQDRNTLLTGNLLACPEYRTQLCRFASAPAPPAAPKAPSGRGSSIGSGISLPAPPPSTGPRPTSTAATTDQIYEPSCSMMKPPKSVFDWMASKAMKMSSRATDQMRTAAKKLTMNRSSFRSPKGMGKRPPSQDGGSSPRLTLCAVILLMLLPCGRGAPVTEPENLIYQENLARSKRFIVPLIIGTLWGWFAGPIVIPSAFPKATFNRTSNQTTWATDEDRFRPKSKSFSLYGFVWDLLSGSGSSRPS